MKRKQQERPSLASKEGTLDPTTAWLMDFAHLIGYTTELHFIKWDGGEK